MQLPLRQLLRLSLAATCLAASSPMLHAQTIQTATVDLAASTITLTGSGFDAKTPLAVSLGGVPLTVQLVAASTLTASLGSTSRTGTYLLSLTGKNLSQQFDVTLGAVGPRAPSASRDRKGPWAYPASRASWDLPAHKAPSASPAPQARKDSPEQRVHQAQSASPAPRALWDSPGHRAPQAFPENQAPPVPLVQLVPQGPTGATGPAGPSGVLSWITNSAPYTLWPVGHPAPPITNVVIPAADTYPLLAKANYNGPWGDLTCVMQTPTGVVDKDEAFELNSNFVSWPLQAVATLNANDTVYLRCNLNGSASPVGSGASGTLTLFGCSSFPAFGSKPRWAQTHLPTALLLLRNHPVADLFVRRAGTIFLLSSVDLFACALPLMILSA